MSCTSNFITITLDGGRRIRIVVINVAVGIALIIAIAISCKYHTLAEILRISCMHI